MIRITVLGAAALALGTVGSAALAQEATSLGKLTQEQKDHGVETFRLLASAMQSQNVPDDVKSVLMGCMYENSVGKISEAVDKVIAANPGKVDRAKPEQVLGVVASICGYEPKAAAGAPSSGKAPAGKAPAPSSSAVKGR